MIAVPAVPELRFSQKRPFLTYAEILRREWAANRAHTRARIALLPWHWAQHTERELERRGGAQHAEARAWLDGVTDAVRGRLSMASSDDDLRHKAKEAAADGAGLAGTCLDRQSWRVRSVLAMHCNAWGIVPAKGCGDWPAIRRMLCARWWLRKLRRAFGRQCDGAAIRAGVVHRGLWAYASQDAVTRRTQQRKRNKATLERAVVACDETGEVLSLAEVSAGTVANPVVKRGELMVRIKGCDAVASDIGAVCEFWTITAPSRYHAQRIVGSVAEPNPSYSGATPRDAQEYLSKVWARARAAWKRRGLGVFGLRTAEPHHDGCPHWHLIAYGEASQLRFARRLLHIYALRDSPDELGARKHRFTAIKARAGTGGAAYAAKYVSKNIDGGGLEGERDAEVGAKVSATVLRVDTWASVWGIRQFQFFGCPRITLWRTLRRMRGPVAVVGSVLECARSAADRGDFGDFWRAVGRGGLALVAAAAGRLTMYGDAAADRIVGVAEGVRVALLPLKTWAIHWSGKVPQGAAGGAFDLPRSRVNNCTRLPASPWDTAAEAIFAIG